MSATSGKGTPPLKSARSGGQRDRGARPEESAGGVVLRRIGGRIHALLIKDPYGNWGLPKGHLEGSEGPPEAGLREVSEETGLGDLVLGPKLRTIDWYFRLRGRLIHKFCTFYLMVSKHGDPIPQEAEGITDCRWIPLLEAVDALDYENAREVVRDAARIALGPKEPQAIDV
ncbi:MAG: NUDIX hydrolase [Gemmatimonadetes bacterium]|nr:NUDIX hydrolase [Gemmatimonadota bacterium]